MFILEKCCFCISLKTGTLLIGMLCLGGSVMDFLFDLLRLKGVTDEFEFIEGQIEVEMVSNFILSSINGAMIWGAAKDSKYFLTPWLLMYGSTIVMVVFLSLAVSLLEPLFLLVILVASPLAYLWFCVMSYYISLDPTRNIEGHVSATFREPAAYEGPFKYPEVV